jgi:hypothetical protein
MADQPKHPQWATAAVLSLLFAGCLGEGSGGYVLYSSLPGPPAVTEPEAADQTSSETEPSTAVDPTADVPLPQQTDSADTVTAAADTDMQKPEEPVEAVVGSSPDSDTATTADQTTEPVKPDAASAGTEATTTAAKPTVTSETSDATTVVPASATADSQVPTPTVLEGGIRLLIPEKTFRKEGPDGALRLSYDDIDLLKILNMEPVPLDAEGHFPSWLQELDGKRIRIRGFMYPTFEATGLTDFLMARDNGICCFVRQPKIYDIIIVNLAKGETTDYIEGRPFDVEGVFRIQPEADNTELYQLYLIEDARVLK